MGRDAFAGRRRAEDRRFRPRGDGGRAGRPWFVPGILALAAGVSVLAAPACFAVRPVTLSP